MANEHPIDNLMKSTMENLRDMIDVNTVIGDAVETKDGSYIIPISKVAFGFATGGSEFGTQCKPAPDKDAKYPFGGGSGAGVTVKPVAFLVLREDAVRLLPVDQDNTYDRIVDSVPQVIDMLKSLCSDMGKKKSKHSKSETTSNKNDNNESNNANNNDNNENPCSCDDSDSSSNNLY